MFETGPDGLKKSEINKKLGARKKEIKKISRIIEDEIKAGNVTLKKDNCRLVHFKEIFKGKITRAARNHGFVVNEATNEEFFVRGRYLIGAVPGDTVLARIVVRKNKSSMYPDDTAVILAVTEQTESIFTGIIVKYNEELRVLPMSFAVQKPLMIIKRNGIQISEGDKVRIALVYRAETHSEHIVEIISNYGSADKARVSTKAYLEEKAVSTVFPEEVMEEAEKIGKKKITSAEIAKREDLRNKKIFTIDGADTKDIDDAISIERTKNGYKLGVHIADVSHYVKKSSAVEKEAFKRGTSIYIADQVIPMLPKQLSNGICSLNPGEDRLAFSCIMSFTKDGEMTKFKFKKSVICSRVQGVYSEVNAILDGTADKEIKKKYKEVSRMIPVMAELAGILSKNREKRGAPDIDSRETKIICNEDGVCVDIKARGRGISESIIEEFMLAANNAAAKVGMENQIPFVYRIHENPSPEKLIQLQETLTNLGVNAVGINENSTARDLRNVLVSAANTPLSQVINRLVLRTMMKAKYSEEPVGHFGLVMKEYAHFTSPIRRYADLSIHRILTDYAAGLETNKILRRYKKTAPEAAARASTTELIAVNAERDCEKYYAAEYMRNFIGEEFEGIISGVIPNAVFVELPNTVEGRIDITALPEGNYDLLNNISLVESNSNISYTIGEKVRVKCAASNPAMGIIDFELIEKY